jgi:multidrug efflux system membrane fusion protein
MNTAQLDPTRTKQANQTAPTTASPASDAAESNASKPSPAGGSYWWVYLIVAALVIALGLLVWHRMSSSSAAGADTSKARAAHDLPVMVAKARRGDLNQYLVGLGTVTPLNTVTVKSRVDGAIMKIRFKEGQKVKVGDPLIDIDDRPYQAALEQAQGQLKRDQAAEANAEWNVQQDTIALKTNAIAQQQLHNDTSTMDQSKAAIEIDNANIATAQLNITYSHITSPIDGVVGLKLVDEGNIVHAADTTGLVVLTQLQPITVVFTVAEDDLEKVEHRVAEGQPIVVDAYDRNMTKKLAVGKVLAVDNEIDPTTGTVKIKAIFDNTDNALYPSQFVNASMLVNTITNAVLVPTAAIQHSPTSTFAYVVVPARDASGKPVADTSAANASAPSTRPARPPMMVTMRQVTTGASQAAVGADTEDTTVVLSGLEPGDVVVTDGVDKLIEGTRVVPTFAPTPAHATTQMSTTMPSGMPSASMSATTQPTHRGHHKAE